MDSTWEPRLTAAEDADQEQVEKIIEVIGEKRTTRAIGPNAWRIDLGLGPTDDWTTARKALEQDLDSIDGDWRKVLRIEA